MCAYCTACWINKWQCCVKKQGSNIFIASWCCKTNSNHCASTWVGLMNLICAHSRVCLLEQQTKKMAEGQDPGPTPAKSEFIIISAFEICNKNCALSTDTFYHVYCVYYKLLYTCTGYFSTNSSSHAHYERALECSGFGREMAFAWSEVGTGRSRTTYNWAKPPWRQWALQARGAESLASKCQTSHLESSRWCPSSDGRVHSCLEDIKQSLLLL